ncbi:uncharacterized protein ISCGN_005921 [Ixodes scapularis]
MDQERPSKWKTFASSRVAEIQRDTDPSHWRYCPGNDNPADLLTRGITVSGLVSSDLWWSGPKWLTEHENERPDLRSSNEAETDLLKEERKAVHVILQTTPPEPLLDLTKYSELHRALRVTTWCLRFLGNCRNGKPSNGPLSAEETTVAELYWINNVQNSTYSDEIKCLSKKENIHKQSSLAEMSPFLDKDIIIRVGGRLQMLPASDNVKHPIILPSEHYLTTLVVLNAHCKVLHGGARDTLAQLRERFWIIGGKILACLPDPTTETEHQSKRTDLLKRIKYRRCLTDNFWKRWQHKYLLQLRSAHHMQRASASTLSVDDVVFVHDSNAPRQLWPMGRVLKTHRGRDGNIRSCQLKLQNGSNTDRPVQRLYPPEVSA